MRYRWIGCLAAILFAIFSAAACSSHPQIAKVVRTDGTAVIGELVTTSADAVVVKTTNGQTETIPRAQISSIETPSAAELAAINGGQSGGSGSGGGDAATGGGAKDGGTTGGNDGTVARNDAGSGTSGGGNAGGGTAGGGTSGGGTAGGGNAGGGTSGGNASGGGNAGHGTSGGNAAGGGSGSSGTSGSGGGTSGSGTAGRDTGGKSGAGNDGAGNGSGPGRDGGSNSGVPTIVLAAGTPMTLKLASALDSNRTRVEEPIEGTLSAPVVGDRGVQALPAGTHVRGIVTEATPAARADGKGRLAVRFHIIVVGSEEVEMETNPVRWQGGGMTKNDAKKVGIGAAIGAGIGRVVARTKKGLGIGAAAGAAGTAIIVMRSRDVHLAPGATVRVRLAEALTLRATP